MNLDEARKELFYWFGVACYQVQGYEYEMKHLLVLNGVLRQADLDRHPDFAPLLLSKKTLGRLSQSLRKYVGQPERVEAQLRDCLAKRNRIIHDFFVNRQDDLNAPDSVMTLTQEVRAIGETFKMAIFDLQIACEGIELSLEFRDTKEWLRAQRNPRTEMGAHLPLDESRE